MRKVLSRLYQQSQLRGNNIYKIYLLLIQMQLRVPNQYKPSFLENLFSPFVPLPTRRILSDKKMQKQKKINLSLTDDSKTISSKKIKISNSFDVKATPSTNQRHTNNVSQFSTLRRGIGAQNRGLNFHPRKINFQNEVNQNVKKRSHISIVPFLNHYNNEESQELITKERNDERQSEQSTNCRIRDKRMATFFSAHDPSIAQKIQTQCSNINPEFTKSFEKVLPKASISSKNKTQNTDKIKQRLREDYPKPQKQCINSPSLRSLIKNKAKLQLKQRPVKQQAQEQSQLFLIRTEPKTQQNPALLYQVTPKNNRNGLSIKTQSGNNALNNCRPITSLFDNAMTIQSKNDDSSKRSNSDCYSNVIERIKIEEIKFETDEGPREWESLQRKSLNANLLSKFQQNKQPIHYTRQTEMNFRKKKSGAAQSQNRVSSRSQFDDLKYIEETYINNNVDYHPFSTVSQQSAVEDEKKKTIYEVFNKVNYLGVGRFASVYLCSTDAHFIFAMKQILKFTVMYNSVEKQMRDELEIQYSCNHPHILNLYHFWQDDKKYYLALQYGQQTLLNKLQKSPHLSEQECLRYIQEICHGLQYLHQRGIVHRDIKPQNVILVNGTCKIGDFGWATKIESGLLKEPCGTPCYISPQMDKYQTYSTKTDCWSLGILAFELINGKLDEDHFGRSVIHVDSLSFQRNVSKEYKNLIFSLLSEDELDRPSISEVLALPIFRNK